MAEEEKNEKDLDFGDKMAVKFPDWDLLPPEMLIKRPNNDK